MGAVLGVGGAEMTKTIPTFEDRHHTSFKSPWKDLNFQEQEE